MIFALIETLVESDSAVAVVLLLALHLPVALLFGTLAGLGAAWFMAVEGWRMLRPTADPWGLNAYARSTGEAGRTGGGAAHPSSCGGAAGGAR